MWWKTIVSVEYLELIFFIFFHFLHSCPNFNLMYNYSNFVLDKFSSFKSHSWNLITSLEFSCSTNLLILPLYNNQNKYVKLFPKYSTLHISYKLLLLLLFYPTKFQETLYIKPPIFWQNKFYYKFLLPHH